MLHATNITYTVGSKILLNQVSLQAKSGELLVIAGPNGAGKSSLLKVLTQKMKIDVGTIQLNGMDIKHYHTKEISKMRSILSQSYSTSLPFQVEEVVMMGRYPHFSEYPNPVDQDIVQAVIKELEIEHLQKRIYATLSGGEQQRVQLARVLAQIWKGNDGKDETKYLFLDEPISSLDLYHQHAILQTVKRMTAAGYCVVAVLHDLNLITQYADRVLLLSHGRSEAFGTPAEVFTKERIKKVYGLDIHLIQDPVSNQLLIIPDAASFTTKQFQKTNTTHDYSDPINVNRTLESI